MGVGRSWWRPELSPFDSPYAPALVNTYTRAAATQFPEDQKELATFVQGIPSDRAADVFETSRSAGFYVLATGHEFLPVGGFSGRVPAPSLAAFIELVAQGPCRTGDGHDQAADQCAGSPLGGFALPAVRRQRL